MMKGYNIYELKNYTNFSILTDEQKQTIVAKFLSIIHTLADNPIRLILYKDSINISYQSFTSRYPLSRVFLLTKESLDNYNIPDEFRYERMDSLPFIPKLAKEYSSFLKLYGFDYARIKIDIDNAIMEEKKSKDIDVKDIGRVVNASYAKTLTLTKLAYNLQTAFITNIPSDLIIVDISKIPYEQSLKHVMRLSSLITATGSRLLSVKAERLIALREALLRQETELYKLSMHAILFGDTLKDINKKVRELKQALRSSLVNFDSIPFMNNVLFARNNAKEFYIELGSLAILYPFTSMDLLELDGILLGLNVDTNAPIIYDYRLRDNYNIVILASSGSGKSVTAKLFINRFKHNCYLYIIDPQGEYEHLSSIFNADVLRLTDYEQLGLDPYNLFTREEVGDIIADIANADNIARKEIRARSMESDSIFSLYDRLDYAKQYIQDLIKEPLASLFKGDSKLSYRNILSLRGTYGEERVAILLTLALARAWKDIVSIDKSIPKLLVIDEGWMLFNMQSTARFINLLARVGRKLNVILLFITQRPEDILNEYGRALLDNSDTKILLRNTELASKKLADALNLNDEEMDYIITASKGEALMMVKNMKIKARIIPSKRELELFSTTPF